MPPSKVELYAAIRRDARAGMSGRAIEKKYRVGRRTIVSAVSSAWPEPRRRLPPQGLEAGPVQAGHRRDPEGGPGRPAQAAAHDHADLPPADGRARDGRRVLSRGPVLRRRAEAAGAGGGRPRPGRGLRAAVAPPGRRGGGRLRRVRGPAGRGGRQVLPVLPAAVVLRQGGAPGLAVGRAGGVLRGARARLPRAGRGPGREDPLRQPQGRGRAGHRAQPVPGRVRPVDRVPVPLGPGRLLLPARHRRRPREGRRRGADRLVPPQPPGPRPRRAVGPGAERDDRRLGRRRRGPADRRPGADRRRSSSRSSGRCCARCRRSRSRRACGCPRGSTGSPRSWCATTGTRCR